MEKAGLIQQAQTAVREIVRTQNIRPAQLARQLQVTGGTLSNLCNDPEKISEEMLLRIINALAPKTKFKTVSTANYNTMKSVCDEAKYKQRFVGVTGYPGAGKTIAADMYYRNNANTFLIECNSIMNRKQFFAEILRVMGISFEGSLYDMVQAIVHKLNTIESPLLILDEIGKLKMYLMLDLHYIRNATMNNAGIVMVGVEYFYENLRAAAQKQKPGMPELFSRVQAWYELNLPTKKEIEAICKANGVTDEATIKEFQRLKNFRELSNAILNETDESLN